MASRSKSRSRSRPRKAQIDDYDPATRFLFVPHTVTFLAIGLLALIYFSHPFNPDRKPADPIAAAELAYSNAKAGVWAVVFVILGYTTLQGPSTPYMIRPHPAVWRFVHGITICYLLFMTYLLFQNVDDARLFLKNIYPELGVELPERKYGEDCRLFLPGPWRINWPTIKATVFDEFVVAHTIGWWGKALILRDRAMLWTVSISFELLELTFQHMLPNFNECWWDSWILDVAICNFIGIATGMWTVSYFKSKEYNWGGISEQTSFIAKARRGFLQFTPQSFDDFQWLDGAFSTPKRCLQCFFPAVIILFFEVTCFFLKYVLWVPPLNPLNSIRLTILFLMGLPGMKEYYEFIESDSDDIFRKLGSYAWISIAIAFVEILVVIKFSKGLFPQAWPVGVLIAWGLAVLVFAVAFSTWSVKVYRQQRKGKQQQPGNRKVGNGTRARKSA